MTTPDLSLVVACYEEEEALPRFFREARRLLDAARTRGLAVEVVLVDDGSRDGTGAATRKWCGADPRRVAVAHPANRGFGAAMRTGFAAATGRVLVCYDADVTYPIDDVLSLYDALLRTGADVAASTPFGPGGRAAASPFRVLLSRAVARLYRAALRSRGRGVTVLTSAFRAYRREALAGVAWRADGFLAAAELLARLLLAGAEVVEVPSELFERREGRSKMRVGRTALAHLGFLVRVAARAGDLAPSPPPRSPVRRRPTAVREIPGDLGAWNARLNREHPMASIERHRNPAVRAIEARRRREALRRLDPRRGQVVLDVGAEEGAYAAPISERGAHPVPFDIDPAALRSGRARHGAAGVAGDAHRLPFRDRSVPRVLLAEVLEHCPDPEGVLREALRVVTASGRVALSVPDDGLLLYMKGAIRALGLSALIRGLSPGLAPGHLHVFDRRSLRDLPGAAGRMVSLCRDAASLAFFAVVVPRTEGP